MIDDGGWNDKEMGSLRNGDFLKIWSENFENVIDIVVFWKFVILSTSNGVLKCPVSL